MIQSLIFWILFLQILFRACSFLIFFHTFQWTSSECLNFRFSSRTSQSQQKLEKKITHFTIQFPSWHTTLKQFRDFVVFWSRRQVHCCYTVLFSMSTFRPGINMAPTLWFWSRFPEEVPEVFQYHYNFIFPEICNIVLQFHFLINRSYSVCVNSKCALNSCIFESLQLLAWTEKKDLWFCVVHWSGTAPCFLVVNSIGSWFNYFLRRSNQNTWV